MPFSFFISFMKQEEALRVLKMGHSVYIAGEPGAGKTHLLTNFISWLRKNNLPYAVTASTGIAATHIGGSTIHSFSGIGIKKEIGERMLDRMEQDRNLWKRFEKTKVLIIDEVSMLSAEFLDMLDVVCRRMKRLDIPFGGVQAVFAGDFFQLPPVDSPHYAFESDSWKSLNPLPCYLSAQHRQTDKKFSSILLSIREGRVGKSDLSALTSRCVDSDSENITRLFTHNVDVDHLNEERLEKLSGKEHVFRMSVKGSAKYTRSFIGSLLVREVLRLKQGAEVMFVKNDNFGKYVNGTRGTVSGFKYGEPLVKLRSGRVVKASPQSFKKEDDGKVLAEAVQVPLRLAYAVTVHKSQGMTLDEAEMDLGRSFVPGQGYVALSRVRSLSGLYLRSFNDTALQVDQRVVSADRAFRRKSALIEERLNKLSVKDEKKYQNDFFRSCKRPLA